MAEMANNFVTITQLAARLGLTRVAVSDWVKRGMVEAPPRLPITGVRAWSRRDAERIEQWYAARQSRRQPRA